MRTVGVVTVGRSDFGIYEPVLHAMRDAGLPFLLFAGGGHVSEGQGRTIGAIRAAGFEPDETLDFLEPGDSPAAVARSMAKAVEAFAQAYDRRRPDVLLVLGDRFEMLAAVVAAAPFRLPVAHISGGEVTEGAIDELTRHAISKMSHLHFVTLQENADRLARMGEERWRIHVTGTPALDQLGRFQPLEDEELQRLIGFPLAPAPLLVTLHPETQSDEDPAAHADLLIESVGATGRPAVFTAPNADPGGTRIRRRVEAYVASQEGNASFAPSLGTRAYFSLMAKAAAMVGNSSSGIMEAASFRLPVVNVGDRQKGRPRPPNVIDTPFDKESLAASLRKALDPGFRGRLSGNNPFGDGRASQRIVKVLSTVPLGTSLTRKRWSNG